jgi:hypothetical protein
MKAAFLGIHLVVFELFTNEEEKAGFSVFFALMMLITVAVLSENVWLLSPYYL